MAVIVCTPKTLSPEQLEIAARRSIEVNPANADQVREVELTPTGRRGGQRRLALLTGSRWPESGQVLSVRFLDNPRNDLRKRILLHMNAWNKTANIRFEETKGTGMVRIARLTGPPEVAGYWSWVGTQILAIDEDEPTMNLEGFTMKTSEAEFRRVVRHEAGHTLGFEHEHMRGDLVKKIDRRKAIEYYDRTNGWTEEDTIAQVLTPLSARSIMATTESDPVSIMCYEIPAEITKDGKAIKGGVNINPKDYEFAGKVYPKRRAQAAVPAGPVEPAEPVVAAAAASASAGPKEPEGGEFHIVIMDDFDPLAGAGVRATGKAKGPKFARVFASYDGARVSVPMRLRADKGEPSTNYGRIIGFHERIKDYTNREKGTLPTDDEMIEFGGYLFDTLFQGDVRRLYDEARARQRSGKLSIVVTSMIPWIAEKPWEFAYDTSRKSFLATEEIHLLRNVLTATPANLIPAPRGPLRILIASAQPVGLGRLSIEQEVEVIRRGFQPLIDAGLVEVEVMARATPGRIHGTLSTGRFNVVHFIGHGFFDEEKQEGALIFEDERGGQVRLSERSAREIFCQRGVSLIFLNACQTGSGGRADFNKGVAQALVSHGLPALIANQYSVLDSSATSFAQHFYWSLAQGMGIGQAACEARIAVNYSLQGEIIDWAVPVVYARDPLMTLCAKPDKMVPAPAVGISRSTRRVVRPRPMRVAVWDIDNAFPALEQTLEHLTAAQREIGFELVALSAPVDAWDMETRAPDDTPYLWAEKVAGRLDKMAMELRVDVLACMTRHWMRDDYYYNIYGWWPDGMKPPVVLFSYAGFDELPFEGVQTNRAIANVLVTVLAGFQSELEAHDDRTGKCPMSFNETRKTGFLVNEQAFDAGCLAKMRKTMSKERITALQALLKAFH